MRPLATQVAWLDDFELCFDLPVGPGERGVANLRPAAGRRTWGLLYRLGVSDCRRLDRSEGVPMGLYDRLDVEVGRESLDAPIAAFTYHSRHRSPGRKPSARYLGILLDGARHHALPDRYVAHLEGYDLAIDEREQSE